MNLDETTREQRALCNRYGLDFIAAPPQLKLGLARNVLERIMPINGLRHPPSADTTGWYIWAGEELSQDPDFFIPLHIEHLAERCPDVLRFLGLPPGSRFLLTHEYEDVWEDPSLLNV